MCLVSRSHRATFLLIGIGDPFRWDQDELPPPLRSLRVLFSVIALSQVLDLLGCLTCGPPPPHPRLQAETVQPAGPTYWWNGRIPHESPLPGPTCTSGCCGSAVLDVSQDSGRAALPVWGLWVLLRSSDAVSSLSP